MSRSLYQKVEACERKPQREFAAQCDVLFGMPGVFARIYRDMIAGPYPAWFGPRVVHEDRASVIADWGQRGIPGLLQTKAYARAVIRACRPYDRPDALEQTVQARLERQEILGRDSPPRLWAVIAEGVLRQCVGGPEVMREQLDHLVKMPGSPQAVIQVLPFTATDAPGADGPVALFEFEDEPPVAYLEGWDAGRVAEEPKEVAVISAALNMIMSCALCPQIHSGSWQRSEGEDMASEPVWRVSTYCRARGRGAGHQGPGGGGAGVRPGIVAAVRRHDQGVVAGLKTSRCACAPSPGRVAGRFRVPQSCAAALQLGPYGSAGQLPPHGFGGTGEPSPLRF